ncbi:MAG: N4-gp56 family major capsid protein [Thaumarchaeota archaeon]|nr:N4-gp56 family major capsid protein [Nitrososphaerota archaeon]
MAINTSPSFSADVEAYIAQTTLPLARKQLVSYQFGDPLTLPKGRGVVYQAARWNRVPLPAAPLSEGVPPIGQQMTVSMVSATAIQWGDKITLTDVAEFTIKHPMFQIAKQLCSLAVAETLERNTFNNIMGGTQINYVNSRGARSSLVAGDVLNLHEFNRAYGALFTLGAIRFDGDEQTDTKLEADEGGAKASANPRSNPHYTAIAHPLCVQDVRENSTFILAASYSDIYRLYNYEIGEWGGIRFCVSNMVPFFTGYAQVNGTPGSSGSLATNSYYIVVTGTDEQNQYESYVAAVSNAVAVTGPNGSIQVTTPNTAGYTYNVYVGTTSSPANLGTSPSGPTVGPLSGMAVQLPANTVVNITGLGVPQSPPAYPGNTPGLTVYPTFIFGRGAYGQVSLDEIKYTYLDKADKSDPLNQLRVVGWKVMYGTMILNQLFFMRIESTSAFSATFG